MKNVKQNIYITALKKFFSTIKLNDIKDYQNSLILKFKGKEFVFFIHKGWLKLSDILKVKLTNLQSVVKMLKKFLKYQDELKQFELLKKLKKIRDTLFYLPAIYRVDDDSVSLNFKNKCRIYFNRNRRQKELRIRALKGFPKRHLKNLIYLMITTFKLNVRGEQDVSLKIVKDPLAV